MTSRNPEQESPIDHRIAGDLEEIRERWRSGTAAERRRDLMFLDDLLGELDDLPTESSQFADAVDELRGRIEILMDEIEISLGIEPPPITGDAEPDLDISR